MDYTYFPFFNDFFRGKKLRVGIVLNHQQMRFGLWLMGQNAEVQKEYWDLLKSTEWIKERDAMPTYSVLEAVLVEATDFDDLDTLSVSIKKVTTRIAEEVMKHITE